MKTLRSLILAAMGSAIQSAIASPIDLSNSLPDFFGGGVGSTTEYAGGKDRIVGAVPGMRYVTSGGHLFEWYGTYAQFNLGDVTGFQWGPALALRLGRSDEDACFVSIRNYDREPKIAEQFQFARQTSRLHLYEVAKPDVHWLA